MISKRQNVCVICCVTVDVTKTFETIQLSARKRSSLKELSSYFVLLALTSVLTSMEKQRQNIGSTKQQRLKCKLKYQSRFQLTSKLSRAPHELRSPSCLPLSPPAAGLRKLCAVPSTCLASLRLVLVCSRVPSWSRLRLTLLG